MDVGEKIRILGEASKWDTCASSASKRKVKGRDRVGNTASGGICHSFTEDGRCISLFKTLMTNACIGDCKYCQNASQCSKRTTTFSPDELARATMSLYTRNYVEGLFLSSGIVKDADKTSERMIEAVELLRNKYRFQGYIHLKVIPGESYDNIKRAGQLADRLSINLEAPNKSRLSELSHSKDYKTDILRRQRWLSRRRLSSGHTTQFVVGASDESDKELLRMTDWEYKNFRLKRAYFSAFDPVKHTPLEFKEKTPYLRERRLYNSDFLMRKYNFKFKELKSIMNEEGMLPNEDPKIPLAKEYFKEPVDPNDIPYNELLRIPGIGPITAKRIRGLQRANKKIGSISQLRQIGVVVKRALPFLSLNNVHQTSISQWNG
jgi:putative DNA modification/repair radical SAM protein